MSWNSSEQPSLTSVRESSPKGSSYRDGTGGLNGWNRCLIAISQNCHFKHALETKTCDICVGTGSQGCEVKIVEKADESPLKNNVNKYALHVDVLFLNTLQSVHCILILPNKSSGQLIDQLMFNWCKIKTMAINWWRAGKVKVGQLIDDLSLDTNDVVLFILLWRSDFPYVISYLRHK